eukprot:m.270739 g.270739  ORF g.270739 m.270739 type:complete len:285 (+) comp91318_c0_seq1:179-1033(+)
MGFTWNGYTEESLHRIIANQRKDPAGLAFIAGLFFCMVWLAGGFEASKQHVSHNAVMGNPLGAALLAGVAVWPLLFSMFETPLTEKKQDADTWAVQTHLGRWIYLTRWLLTLQFWFSVASMIAETYGGQTRIAMYSFATPMTAFAVFVTIQYYSLVRYNPKFLEKVALWKSRGEDLVFIGDVEHAPAAIISLVDLFIVKDRKLLQDTRPEFGVLVFICLVFALAYTVVLVVNHQYTGQWPYPFMASITSVGTFMMFVFTQCSILIFFVTIVWCVQTGVVSQFFT